MQFPSTTFFFLSEAKVFTSILILVAYMRSFSQLVAKEMPRKELDDSHLDPSHLPLLCLLREIVCSRLPFTYIEVHSLIQKGFYFCMTFAEKGM